MSDITVINDSEQSSLVTNGLAKNGELYLKAAGSTDAGAIVVYDSGSWRTFANEYSSGFSNTYSVDFDGSDDHVDLGTAYDHSGDMTISMWAKYTDINSSYLWLASRMVAHPTYQYNIYLRGETTGAKSLAFATSSGSSVASGTVSHNTWTHLLFSVQSGVAGGTKSYINGVAETLSATHTVSSASSYTQYIGRSGRYLTYAFKGLIDEVAYFDSALDATDAAAVYNSGVPADLSSLSPVMWYRMGDNDGGTGTTITDQGSGGYDGTLTNGPTFSTNVPS